MAAVVAAYSGYRSARPVGIAGIAAVAVFQSYVIAVERQGKLEFSFTMGHPDTEFRAGERAEHDRAVFGHTDSEEGALELVAVVVAHRRAALVGRIDEIQLDHELTAGEILRELADKARLEFERHQSEYETALRHQAEIESTIKALAVDKEKTDNELGRLNEEKKRLSDDLSVKSHELGITVDSNLADTISHHTATVADRIGELSSQIAAAETLEKTVGELRASVDNIQRRLDSARKSCEKVRQILSGALERRSAISATIETNNVNIASTLDELSAVLDLSLIHI